MLGLVALGLSSLMIFTLVKNALFGKQLSKNDVFYGTIELIIPINANSEFFLEAWQKTLSNLKYLSKNLKVHILIDGHHPAADAWKELRLPNLEIHNYSMRPQEYEAEPWMIEQISKKIQSEIVIIGDAELVANEHAFLSIAKIVSDKQKTYYVLPQTVSLSKLGEAVALLNPNLALASFFGFKRWRRNLSHPLMSITQGWMAMPLSTFKEINFSISKFPSWKDTVARQLEKLGKTYNLAFGEKHLKKYYPEIFKVQIFSMRNFWVKLYMRPDKAGLLLYLTALFLWSFPVLFFMSHPFWSLASIMLLIVYRFFTKIVFQESWGAMVLHPVACLIWIWTLIWWIISGLKSKYGSQARIEY